MVVVVAVVTATLIPWWLFWHWTDIVFLFFFFSPIPFFLPSCRWPVEKPVCGGQLARVVCGGCETGRAEPGKQDVQSIRPTA